MTGGPNNFAAEISYPAMLPDGQYVNYNFKDTVNIEWVSWAANSSKTTMQIYYWQPSFGNSPWQGLQKVTVPQNGSRAYKLNDVVDKGDGWYLGQWNLNFTREDNDPPTGLTLSQTFNCTFDKSLPAQTFGKAIVASPTASLGSATSSSSSSTPTGTSSSQTSNGVLAPGTTAAATDSPVATNNGLSGGAIAGIIIGVLVILALVAAGAFLFLRRRRAVKAQVLDNSGLQGPPPGYTPYTAGQPPMTGPAAGPAPAMYAGVSKQAIQSEPMPVNGAGYYGKEQPIASHMTQQTTYSELPSHGAYTSTTPSHFAEMPASQPMRQELPG